MEVFDYILWGLTETIKYVFISYGVLGYQCRQLKPTLPPMYYRFTRM